jgi:hypothetical protein
MMGKLVPVDVTPEILADEWKRAFAFFDCQFGTETAAKEANRHIARCQKCDDANQFPAFGGTSWITEMISARVVQVIGDGPYDISGFGRVGTARCSRGQLTARLGVPLDLRDDHEDPKVTHGWVFRTPDGDVELGDYWWNRPDEYSVRGNPKAARWLMAWLRRQSILARPVNRRWWWCW